MTARRQPDVVVLVQPRRRAMAWARRHGYRRPLVPHSPADLQGLPADVPLYADLSLWDSVTAPAFADWLAWRLRLSQPAYDWRAWVAQYASKELN